MVKASTSKPSAGSATASGSSRPRRSWRIRSFRARIGVLSACASGVVLAAFALSAWLLIRNVSLQRLDDAIMERAMREMGRPGGPMRWARLEHSFDPMYGGNAAGSVLVLALDASSDVIYRSAQWPAGIPQAWFPPIPPPPGLPPAPLPDGPPPNDMPPGPPPDMGPDGPPPPEGDRGPGPPRHGPPPLRPQFWTVRADGRPWHFGVVGDGETTLAVGLNLDVFAPDITWTRNAFLAALPVGLLLIGVVGWWVSRRALGPVEALTEATERITARGLDQRIAVAGEDLEFLRLITVFNEMMDRLETSFNQAVRFSADAAHEFKTPLTILQGQLEEAVQTAAPGSDDQARYGDLLGEVHRLKSIVRHLLLLSLADSGQLTPHLVEEDLSAMLEGVVEDTRELAPQLQITADVPSDVHVMADADLLVQVLRNLASNAMKYNREGGFVRFALSASEGPVELAVTNSGSGISSEDEDRVFERFFRADQSRGRKVDGLGLGLSLSREIVRAHGGKLVLAGGDPDATTFVMTLPAVTGPQEAQ